MKQKKTPAPRRAGTPSKRQAASLLRGLWSRDPEAYEALMFLVRRSVEKKSTNDLTG